MVRQDQPDIQFDVIIGKRTQGTRQGTCHIAQSAYFYKRFGFRRQE